MMNIKIGFELTYQCPQPTPMVLTLNVHPERRSDLVTVDALRFAPSIPHTQYSDSFGNICTRIVAPAGTTTIATDAMVVDTGLADAIAPDAWQTAVEHLPPETLVFLQGSRYCETDLLSERAWALFGQTPLGWARVQAICHFVHNHIKFRYADARATRSALGAFEERKGVCRDFAHLAIALCRCMNIPARYCTGYLGDIGVPLDPEPMDFSAWFEAYLGGRWYTFDARHNKPRIGRILMARGRDATDCPLSNAFGLNTLTGFKVWTEELPPAAARA